MSVAVNLNIFLNVLPFCCHQNTCGMLREWIASINLEQLSQELYAHSECHYMGFDITILILKKNNARNTRLCSSITTWQGGLLGASTARVNGQCSIPQSTPKLEKWSQLLICYPLPDDPDLIFDSHHIASYPNSIGCRINIKITAVAVFKATEFACSQY